jgi:hypothetical protein
MKSVDDFLRQTLGPPKDQWLTAHEVADLAGVSLDTAYRLGPSLGTHIRRSLRFSRRRVLAYLEHGGAGAEVSEKRSQQSA